MEPVADQQVWHSWTADRAYPRHVVHANVRIVVRRRSTIALAVIFVLLTAVAFLSPEAGFVAPGILAALAATLYVTWNIRVRSVLSAGATYRAAVGAESLVAETPYGTIDLLYGLLSEVRAERHVVLVKDRSTRQWMILPRGVLPDAALDQLRERIRVASPITTPTTVESDSTPSPQGPTTSYTTDAEFVRRRSRAFFATVVLGPSRVARVAVIIVVCVALASNGSLEAAVVYAAVMVAAIAVLYAFAYRRLLRVSEGQVPVGTTYRAELGPTALWVG